MYHIEWWLLTNQPTDSISATWIHNATQQTKWDESICPWSLSLSDSLSFSLSLFRLFRLFRRCRSCWFILIAEWFHGKVGCCRIHHKVYWCILSRLQGETRQYTIRSEYTHIHNTAPSHPWCFGSILWPFIVCYWLRRYRLLWRGAGGILRRCIGLKIGIAWSIGSISAIFGWEYERISAGKGGYGEVNTAVSIMKSWTWIEKSIELSFYAE